MRYTIGSQARADMATAPFPPIISATRSTSRLYKSRASNSRGYIGLKYERSVVTALKAAIPSSMKLERNPWFIYNDGLFCCPDILIFDNEFDFIIVIEVKNTYTPQAFEKLSNLYCPVVRLALNKPVKPLVIVKNLVPDCPLPKLSLSSALLSDIPLLQYLGTGNIRI